MGTDIHMVAQVWRPDLDYWRTIYPPAWWPRDGWRAERIAELTAQLPDGQAAKDLASYTAEWDDGRNYDLFGVLANVRNATGFAGVRRLDEGWPSIAPGRGYPEDFEHDDDNEHDGVWMGDHSHTWLTLAELFDYPWTTTRQSTGIVSLAQFAEREARGTAYESWCGGMSGPNLAILSAPQAREMLRAGGVAAAEGTEVYVRDSWGVTAAEACGYWHDTLLPAFRRLTVERQVSPAEIRLVMGFDS